MDDTVEKINMLQREEYKYQRLVDAAETAQDSVSRLANVIDELVDIVRKDQPEVALYAEGVLSRVPFLRKIPLTHDIDGEYRYAMELPYMLSPFGNEIQEKELTYLRRIRDDRYGFTNPYRFVRENNGIFDK
jgi:hypothetical protein